MADSPALVQSYPLYIDGDWVEPQDGRYDDISPSTEDVIATAPDASVAQVGEAIAAARRAFDSGPWRTMSAEERAGCLNQLGEALSKHADDFFALSQVEWGCVANERIMQIDGAGFMSMHAAQLATQLKDEEVTGMGAGTTLLRHEPLGVVSVLTPWNFPHCLNVMKLNHALAAGNTVVLKPSPLTPLAGLALARIIDEHTDIPPGVVNVVTPSGVEAARLLTTDPRIDMVSFTGSSVVGRQVMSAAGDTMKRILLELGGKSASIVLDDAQVTDEMLQQMLFDCCSLHAGQACILHSRLLLPDSLHDDVVEPNSTIAQEEVFGPVLTVLRYRDDDDAVAIANNSQYGLSGAVWGGDVDRAVGVARRIRTGQIAVNGCGPGGAPFGGFKLSGLGREGGGIGGLHQYMEPMAIGVPA